MRFHKNPEFPAVKSQQHHQSSARKPLFPHDLMSNVPRLDHKSLISAKCLQFLIQGHPGDVLPDVRPKSPMSQFIHRQQTATGQPPRGQVMIRRAAVAGPFGSEEEPSFACEVVDTGEETLQGAANVEIPAMRSLQQKGYLLGQNTFKNRNMRAIPERLG